jgi:hypothetical protein
VDKELPAQGFALGDGAGAAVADLAVEGHQVGPGVGVGVPDPPQPGIAGEWASYCEYPVTTVKAVLVERPASAN